MGVGKCSTDRRVDQSDDLEIGRNKSFWLLGYADLSCDRLAIFDVSFCYKENTRKKEAEKRIRWEWWLERLGRSQKRYGYFDNSYTSTSLSCFCTPSWKDIWEIHYLMRLSQDFCLWVWSWCWVAVRQQNTRKKKRERRSQSTEQFGEARMIKEKLAGVLLHLFLLGTAGF